MRRLSGKCTTVHFVAFSVHIGVTSSTSTFATLTQKCLQTHTVASKLPTVVLPVLSRVESPAPEAAPSPVMVRSSSDVSISGDYDDDAEVFIEPRPPSPVSAMGVGQWY